MSGARGSNLLRICSRERRPEPDAMAQPPLPPHETCKGSNTLQSIAREGGRDNCRSQRGLAAPFHQIDQRCGLRPIWPAYRSFRRDGRHLRCRADGRPGLIESFASSSGVFRAGVSSKLMQGPSSPNRPSGRERRSTEAYSTTCLRRASGLVRRALGVGRALLTFTTGNSQDFKRCPSMPRGS